MLRAENCIILALKAIYNTKNFKKDNTTTVVYPQIVSHLFYNYFSNSHESQLLYVDEQWDHLNHDDLVFLKLISLGCTNFFLAERLNLSESTVARKILHLKDKLHVQTRKELIKISHDPKISIFLKQLNLTI